MPTVLLNKWPPINLLQPSVTIARLYLYDFNTLYYQITNFDLYYALGITSTVNFINYPPIALITNPDHKLIVDEFIREFYQ